MLTPVGKAGLIRSLQLRSLGNSAIPERWTFLKESKAPSNPKAECADRAHNLLFQNSDIRNDGL